MMAPFGSDLSVVPYMVAQEASQLDIRPRVRRIAAEDRLDLEVVSGRENLAQALILRLLTPKGYLAPLGHANYGSRLHELVGRRKTASLRHLCRALVLEVLAQESRISERAVALTFLPDLEAIDSFVFELEVMPVDEDTPLGLSLEVRL